MNQAECNESSDRILRLREEIDCLDKQISSLLLQRLEIAVEVGCLKNKAGLPVKDLHREEDVLEKVAVALTDRPLAARVLKLYERILQECRDAQNT